MPDKYLPGGVEAWLLTMNDGTAKIVATDGYAHAMAEIVQPATADTCSAAMSHVIKELKRENGSPRVGDFVSRVDRTSGEFWLNDRFGPFKFEVQP
jgi:hypothetical protein